MVSKVEGDSNEIRNSEKQEINFFHWTSLNERIVGHQRVQGQHNLAKYILITVILLVIMLVMQ